jgi:uncharacterized metal-binding protein YceD (DUF177 family)
MSKFELYNINLKSLSTDKQTLEFDLNEEFFKKIDSPEVQKGTVKAKVIVQKKTGLFELTFKLEGEVMVPCNRCLDDMVQTIKYDDKLQVKLGDSFSEENEIVIIPENEGILNIAWFMYEFIVLNIPIKHVHAPGECNKTMVTKLKKHITRHKDDDEDNPLFEDDDDDEISNDNTAVDPRWEGLQNIFDNN